MTTLEELNRVLETFFPEKQTDLEALNLAIVAFIFADHLFSVIPDEGEGYDFSQLFEKFNQMLEAILAQHASDARSITQVITQFAQALDQVVPHHLKDRMTGYSFHGINFLQTVTESQSPGLKTLEVDPQSIKRLVTNYQRQRRKG